MKTKHAKLILAPSRDEGEWKSSSIMMMDMRKCPTREIEFKTFDELNAKALSFAMDREAYTQARALEATDDTTKGTPGVQVQVQCLDARKPAGWKKATARPIYFFPEEATEKAAYKMADEIRKSPNIIYLTCEK